MDYQQAYAAAADPFSAIVRGGRDWGAKSPCEGWTAADVLHHVRTTQREFLASHGLDQDWPADQADPVADWLAHDARVRALLSDEMIRTRAIDGYFGPSTIGDLLAGFYGWDLLVHRWDLASALGVDAGLTDAELDAIEAPLPMFGDQLYSPGICQSPLDAPPDADRQARVLARLGRRG